MPLHADLFADIYAYADLHAYSYADNNMDLNTDNTAPLFVYNHADFHMNLYAYNFAVLSCAKPLLFPILASDSPTGIPFALTGIHIARGQTVRPDLPSPPYGCKCLGPPGLLGPPGPVLSRAFAVRHSYPRP